MVLVTKNETKDECETIFQLVVESSEIGQRLDSFLSKNLNLSRARVQSLLAEGHISSPKLPKLSAALKIKNDQIFQVVIPQAAPADPMPQKIDLEILYEDEHLLVIEKPSGLVIHPAPGNQDMTLVNALLHHCQGSLSGIGGVKRPGIVHRLDKDTSGLMVVAKNDDTHQDLTRQFSERSIERAYYALIWGIPRPSAGKIEGDIGRHPKNRQKMAIVEKNGRYALTYYKTLQMLGNWASLIECKLATGRTHQIRVHMSSIGHPIIGDPVYGGSKFPKHFSNEEVKQEMMQHKGQLLHAYKLGFIHPLNKKNLFFESKLPSFFENTIKLLSNL